MAEKLDPYTMRITEENKEKIRSFVDELNISNNDFMDVLLKTYQLEVSKKPYLDSDYSALQKHTQAINNLFINLGDKIEIENKTNQAKIDEALSRKDQEITKKQEQIEELKQDYQELTQAFEAVKADKKSLIEDFQKTISANEELREHNTLLKEKNQLLKETVADQEDFVIQIEALEKRNSKLNEYIGTYKLNEATLKEQHTKEITELEKELELKERNIAQLKEDHKQQIETTKERLGNECKRLLLVDEKKHLDEIGKINRANEELIREIQVNYSRALLIKSQATKEEPK